MNQSNTPELPVVADCRGCGVCCFHMGYPAFVLPVEPLTDAEIDSDPELSKKVQNQPQLRAALKAGRKGEPRWYELPPLLKAELEETMSTYTTPEYGSDPSTFDGPCIWLDRESRLCRHHEYRPNVCRDFSVGSQGCLDWREHYRDQIRDSN